MSKLPGEQPLAVPEVAEVRRRGPVTSALAEAGDLISFSAGALRATGGATRYTSEVLRQAALLVTGSTLIIAAMSAFVGVALVTFSVYFLKAAGAGDYVGAVTGLVTPRFTAPLMFGYVFAAKVGSGLTAELGTMRIAEELDGLEAEGVDPLRYVVGTRLIAMLLFLPVIAGASLLAGTAGAYVNAIWILDALPAGDFLADHWGFQNMADQVFAVATMVVLGVVIVLTACFFGYRAQGGPAGVGVAVARSLVVNLVLVHVVVSVANQAVYGSNIAIPVGG